MTQIFIINIIQKVKKQEYIRSL